MSKKEDLLEVIQRKPPPKNFTKQDLDQLMSRCGCQKQSGGRGSGIRYVHLETKRVLAFDEPHPGNELYRYQIDKVKIFLKDIGEI